MSQLESAVNQLLALAKDRFGDDFDSGGTGGDTKFFTAMADGTFADYSAHKPDKEANDKENDPENAKDWGAERLLQADRIEWLCTDKEAAALVSHKGIQVGGARITGTLDLNSVRFDRALILLNCALESSPKFYDASFYALYLTGTHCPGINAHRLRLKGALHLGVGFVAKGEVNLVGAAIDGVLSCAGGSFLNKDGMALNANAITVGSAVFLSDEFHSLGEVNLASAQIGRQLACAGGSFYNKGKIALDIDSISVKGDVLLSRGFIANGKVNLRGASIAGQLSCVAGTFLNESDTAISADSIHVSSSVLLTGDYRAEGEVILVGAFIGGQLSCRGCSFLNEGGTALRASAITVMGDVFIGGQDLDVDSIHGGKFHMEGQVNFRHAVIHGSLQFLNFVDASRIILDLRHAKAGVFWDDIESWPQTGNLLLRGFEYDALHEKAPVDAELRKDWLSRDTGDDFNPQPYEQLAKVLSRSGYRSEARTIRIEKERRLAKQERERRLEELKSARSRDRWWKRIFSLVRLCFVFLYGKLTDFGYRPWKVLPWSILIVVAGWPLYEVGYAWEWVTPTRVQSNVAPYSDGPVVYPTFQGLAYSIDAFVPLVNIEQVDYWLPNAARGPRLELGGYYVSCSGFLLFIYYFQVVSGWVLTTLLVVGLTRLVQRED